MDDVYTSYVPTGPCPMVHDDVYTTYITVQSTGYVGAVIPVGELTVSLMPCHDMTHPRMSRHPIPDTVDGGEYISWYNHYGG